jgi:peptidoglycan hydrolase-like protein with peptidoglycan-binding domain
MRRIGIFAATAVAVLASLTACGVEPNPSNAAFNPAPEPSETVVETEPISSPSPEAPPPSSSAPSPTSSPKPACKEGKNQLEVEQILAALGGYGKIQVDGKQSDADCAAVKKFQTRFGLRPVDGVPGGGTLNVAKRLQASDPSRCNAGSELTACIDLTNQTTYLMRDGKVIYGPTVTRTGYDHPDGKGAPTPSGSYKIIERQRSNYTDSFGVYLHYWQRIMGNNGFHETTSYIHDMSAGSHGCVNLLKADAVYYWNNIKVGTPVKVFGRRPGT